MTISNEDTFNIDLNSTYTRNVNFLKRNSVDKILSDFAEIESGSRIDRDDGFYGDLYDNIQNFIISANNRYFRFDIEGFEPIQYLTYSHESKFDDFYIDMRLIKGSITDYKKISFVLQLNTEFVGGEYELRRVDNSYSRIDTVPGSLIVFPSTRPYKINPIMAGTKRVLHGWVYGPQFT